MNVRMFWNNGLIAFNQSLTHSPSPSPMKRAGEEAPRKRPAKKSDAARSVNTQRFAEFDGAADAATRSRTIIRGFEKVVQPGPHAQALAEMVVAASDVFGVLRHLVTAYLNTKAADDPAFPGLLNQNYIARLFKYVAGLPVAHEVYPDPFLQRYLAANPLPPDVREMVTTGYIAQPAQHLAREMLAAAERHLTENLDDRLLAYARLCVECLMWHARDEMSVADFKRATEKCAAALLKGACADDRASAGDSLDVVTRNLGGAWDAVAVVLDDLSELVAPLRASLPAHARAVASPRRAYLYNKKAHRERVICLLRELQTRQATYRTQRGQIWDGINRDLPSLPNANTYGEVWAVRHRFAAVPQWCCESRERLRPEHARAYLRLKRRRGDERGQMWDARAQPGTLDPPRGFTLLPYSPLAPAFITLDNIALSVFSERIRVRLQKDSDAAWDARVAAGERLFKKDRPRVAKPWKSDRDDFLFWTGAFAFYPGQHPDPPHTPRPRTRDSSRRRILKAKRSNDRGGLPILVGEEWVLDPVEYAARRSEAPPRLVNRIRSDGLQVHVTLVDRLDEELPPGVEDLEKGGYAHVTETLDITRHRYIS